MERLTEKRDGQNVIPLRQNGKIKWAICSAGLGDAPTEYLYGDHADRLASIEDILGDEYDLDRLRELVEADREQRCFVFRFGFGSTVYRTWIHPSGSPTFITENKMDTLNDLLNAETWDNAYSTRAEAEATLRREQDG